MSLFDLVRLRADPFLRRVDFHQDLPSTNSRALELAAHDPPTPLLVLAERQTSGRGRGENRWWSAPGALTFSLLVDAAQWNLAPDRWPRVSLAAGVAVCEAVQTLVPAHHVGLKWPNDVHLVGRKVCGILIETPPRVGRLVVGVGLNVNNSFDDAPQDVKHRATSLSQISGARFNPTDVLLAVLRRVELALNLLSQDDAVLAQKWKFLSILTGRNLELNLGSRSVSGMCLGIDVDGALLLQTSRGPERFHAGVVSRYD